MADGETPGTAAWQVPQGKARTEALAFFAEDLRETLSWQPQAEDYAHNPMARQLNDVWLSLQTGYQYLLGFALLAATAFLIYFLFALLRDSNLAFLQVYFGISYLFVVLWTVSGIGLAKLQKSRREQIQAATRRAARVPNLS